jgi:hypothetical protein
LSVARRGVELGMPEQNLDHTNIDVLLADSDLFRPGIPT